MDAIGPMEARLLALERRLVHCEDALRTQQISLTGIGQGIWDAWGEHRRPRGTTPTPTPTGTFPDCCPGYTFPSTLTLVDNVYGNFTLTWDGLYTWKGCKQISFAGSLVCPTPVSMPLGWFLAINGATCTATLHMVWLANLLSCPAAGKTCADMTYGPADIAYQTIGPIACSGGTLSFSVKGAGGPHPLVGGGTSSQTIALP
jgi:hypothetical protein